MATPDPEAPVSDTGLASHLGRLLSVWATTSVAVAVLAGLLEGFSADSVGAIGLASLLLAAANALVWPMLQRYLLAFTVLTLGLGAIVVDALLVLVILELSPGISVQDFGTALVVALGLALVTSLLSWLFALDDDDVFDRQIARQLRRRSPTATTEIPGVLFLQIDGLGHEVLRRAITNGDVPNLARWIRTGTHQLLAWETEWSSQTGVSQCGLLHGSTDDMPAFRWLEKDTGTLLVSNRPSSAREIQRRHSDGKGLLAVDGTSLANLYTGDAERAVLTMSVAGQRKGRVGSGYDAYFSHPYNVLRTIGSYVIDMVRERRAALLQRRRDVFPRVERTLEYTLLRPFTTVVIRDVTVQGIIGEIAVGRSVVYADLLGYDEVAHHSGVERYETMAVLRDIDRQIGRLHRATRRAPRPYRIVVLSDHGQSQGATFLDRYDTTLEQVVREAMDSSSPGPTPTLGRTDEPRTEADLSEAWANLGGALSEASGGESPGAKVVGLMTKPRRTEGDIQVGPGDNRRGWDASTGSDLTVLASGNLGLVYLPGPRRRLTREEIDDRYPDLIETLRNHPGVGFVLVRSDAHGSVVLGPQGIHYLDSGEIDGIDPLAQFGRFAVAKVRKADAYPHVADLMLNSTLDPMTGEVAAFEELVGSHGGMGGGQSRPFLLAPSDWSTPTVDLFTAAAVHRVLKGWLADLGHPVVTDAS